MRLHVMLGALLLALAGTRLVARVSADCGERVHTLTLELTSLEPMTQSSEAQVATERERLGSSALVIGDYEDRYGSDQDIRFMLGDEPWRSSHVLVTEATP